MKTRALAPMVAMALALAACGGDDGGSSGATTTAAPAATTTAAPAATTTVPATTTAAPTTTGKAATDQEKKAVELLVLTSADIPASLDLRSAPNTSNNEESAADLCIGGGLAKVDALVDASSNFENDNGEFISSDASIYDSAATVEKQLAGITADKTVTCLEEALKKDFGDSLASSGGKLTDLTLRRVDYPPVRNIGFAFDTVLTADVAGQSLTFELVIVGQSKGRLTQSLAFFFQDSVSSELIDGIVIKAKAKLDASPVS